MKIKSTLLFGLLALSVAQSSAGIFNVSNVLDGTSELLYASGPSALLSTGVVSIGYFPDGFVPAPGDNAALVANFTVVNSAPIGQAPTLGVGSFPGYAEQNTAVGVGIGNITVGNPLLGRTVYTFIGDGATLASSGKFGLFSVGTIQDDVPVEFDYSTLSPNAPFILGTPGTFVGNASGLGNDQTEFRTIILVPEPTSAMLGAVGALALFRRRRA